MWRALDNRVLNVIHGNLSDTGVNNGALGNSTIALDMQGDRCGASWNTWMIKPKPKIGSCGSVVDLRFRKIYVALTLVRVKGEGADTRGYRFSRENPTG